MTEALLQKTMAKFKAAERKAFNATKELADVFETFAGGCRHRGGYRRHSCDHSKIRKGDITKPNPWHGDKLLDYRPPCSIDNCPLTIPKTK